MWTNWSGSLEFSPAQIAEPADEEEVAALVRAASEQGRHVRVVGAGHSSSPLVETEDVLVSLTKFRDLVSHDRNSCEAVLGAGMTIHEIGAALHEKGLALHNTGDVDVQTLAGAMATGTHGTGRTLPNLAEPLLGGRMITGTGEVRDVSVEREPELVRALRVSLGSVGIMTQLRVRLLPAYQLRRREWCTHIEDCMMHLDELMDGNRNFDFYWYPRSDLAKLRTMNPVDDEGSGIPWADCVLDRTGWSHAILPRERELRFDEMEYVLPSDAGPACFEEVRSRVKERWRRTVGWRTLYRTIAPDDAYLSPMHGRESVTVSLHHNAGLPFREYFQDIEPIFRSFGGRPHWGKKHYLEAADLRPLYPDWELHREQRLACDPGGVFMTPQMRRVLEEDA